MNRSGKDYDAMTLEELQREFREAFFETDVIDAHLDEELERLQEALNRKRPVEYLYTPEESWAHFLEEQGEGPGTGPISREGPAAQPEGEKRPRLRSLPALLRRAALVAAAAVLLAGAALAADSLGLVAWVPKWNAASGRYALTAAETEGRPIPAALLELGITEPIYPARLPQGFVITESHVSLDPLVLMEQYARGTERLSITVTPTEGFRNAAYLSADVPVQEYRPDALVHYIFVAEGTITAVRYTEHYAVTLSGDLPLEEMKGIIDSLYEVRP